MPPVAFDPVPAITTGVNNVLASAMDVVGVVAPAAITIVGAVLVITKGISVFRSLIGR